MVDDKPKLQQFTKVTIAKGWKLKVEVYICSLPRTVSISRRCRTQNRRQFRSDSGNKIPEHFSLLLHSHVYRRLHDVLNVDLNKAGTHRMKRVFAQSSWTDYLSVSVGGWRMYVKQKNQPAEWCTWRNSECDPANSTVQWNIIDYDELRLCGLCMIGSIHAARISMLSD